MNNKNRKYSPTKMPSIYVPRMYNNKIVYLKLTLQKTKEQNGNTDITAKKYYENFKYELDPEDFKKVLFSKKYF